MSSFNCSVVEISSSATSNKSVDQPLIVSGTVLDIITVAENAVVALALLLNLWILFVSWGSARVGSGFFKYPLCYLAFCDVWYSGQKLARSYLPMLLSTSAYQRICAVLISAGIASSNQMICALLITPLQRNLVFYDTCLTEYATSPPWIMFVGLLLFVVPALPSVAALIARADGCMWNNSCPNLAINTFFSNAVRFAPMACYPAALLLVGLLVRKVQQMSHDAGNSDEELAESGGGNRGFLAAVLVQTGNPLLLSTPILVYIAMNKGFEDDGSWGRVAVTAVFHLNPLVDAIATIRFIKVYRMAAKGALASIKQWSGCNSNSAEAVTAAAVATEMKMY